MVSIKDKLVEIVLGKDDTYDDNSSFKSSDAESADMKHPASSVSVADNDTELSEVEQTRLQKLYRKVDMRIIPALWVLYFLTSYGGGAYGNALTMNRKQHHSIPQKLNLKYSDISTATTLDIVGFIVFDLPMNLCFTYVTPKIWLSRTVISVGMVYACLAAVKNASGLKALRFFCGVAGAGVWPGMTYYISMFYPTDYLSSRIGYYFTAAQISTAVAGLLGACFQLMDGEHGYTGYQWNFLIYGVVTMGIGFLLFFWLPNRPRGQKMWPLNVDDNKLLQRELRRQKKTDHHWSWKQFFNVLTDVRILPLVMMYFGVVGTGIGIENYATTILTNINPKWSSITLSLLTAPIWLFDFGGILLITPFSDRYPQHRILIFCFSTSIIICGLFVTTFAKNGWSQWGGLLLCGFGLGPTVPITMSLGATIFHERHGDLGVAMVSALISGLGNLGSVTTLYALYSGWPEDASRHYRDSNMVMVSILGISILFSFVLVITRFVCGDYGDKKFMEVSCLNWLRGRPALA